MNASFPYLKTSSNNNSNFEYLKKSKTKFYTYKLGISIRGEEALNKLLNFYIDGNFAKQIAKVKNNALNLNSSSNGDYFSFNSGIKIQAKTKCGFLTISPSIYALLGYRYDY